jgi:hypothetical protein
VPTFALTDRFQRDWADLAPAQQASFKTAVSHFVADLKSGDGFRKGLRIKRVRRTTDAWELTWAPNGRATWQYGPDMKPGEPHIIWRRIGTHDIFQNP